MMAMIVMASNANPNHNHCERAGSSSFIWFSARPANVAGPSPSVTAAFNVESQPLAELHAEKIDACRLKRAEVQKYIRTAGVILDETEAALGIPHFQSSGSHSVLFSLRLQPQLDQAADGFGAGWFGILFGNPRI